MASSGRVYADRYHYLVEYDRGLSLGVKPQSNFEFFICLHVTPQRGICQAVFKAAGLILDIHAKTRLKYA